MTMETVYLYKDKRRAGYILLLNAILFFLATYATSHFYCGDEYVLVADMLAFTEFGGYMTSSSPQYVPMFWFCLVCAVMLFACLIRVLWVYLDKKPYITMSENGLSIRDKIKIEWSNMANISSFKLHGESIIGILLKRPEETLSSSSKWQRYTAAINYRLFKKHICLGNLSKDAFSIIKNYHDAYFLNKYKEKHTDKKD